MMYRNVELQNYCRNKKQAVAPWPSKPEKKKKKKIIGVMYSKVFAVKRLDTHSYLW